VLAFINQLVSLKWDKFISSLVTYHMALVGTWVVLVLTQAWMYIQVVLSRTKINKIREDLHRVTMAITMEVTIILDKNREDSIYKLCNNEINFINIYLLSFF
jgi:hypothetical protein